MDQPTRDEKTIKKEIENVNKKLAIIENALVKAREITKAIKYQNPTIEIISGIKSLMDKDLEIDADDFETAEQNALEASRALESAIYELDEVFADAHQKLTWDLDELESELGEIEYQKKYSRESMQESKKVKKESQGSQGDIGGAHGEETRSVLTKGPKNENPGLKAVGENKEEIMKNELSTENLQQLAGVKKPVTECGMMGGQTPASINITASNGPELTGMLKDIMSLAGVHKVGPEHMPLASTPGPSTVISAPPMSGAEQGPSMQDMIAIVDEPEEAEPDSMNRKSPIPGGDEDEMEQESYSNSPDVEMEPDGVRRFGDINNNMQNALTAQPVKKDENIEERLLQDYQKFISESVVKEKWAPKKKADKPSPAAGQSSAQIKSKIDSITAQGKLQKGSPKQKEVQALRLALRNKTRSKKMAEDVMGQESPQISPDDARKMLDIINNWTAGSDAPSIIDHLMKELPHIDVEIEDLFDQAHRYSIKNMASEWDYIIPKLQAMAKMSEGWPGDAVAESKKKPSAGMTKKEKSAVVKKAKKGGDIGKPGKGFAKVEKAAKKSGAKNPKAVAAAAMWKQQAKK